MGVELIVESRETFGWFCDKCGKGRTVRSSLLQPRHVAAADL